MDSKVPDKDKLALLLSQIEQILLESGCEGQDMRELVLTCLDEVPNREGKRVGRALQPSTKFGLSPFLTRRLVQYIEEHISTGIRLIDMANQAGLSPYHFSRAFKTALGASPYQYILTRRIELAKEMMLRQEANLLNIAISVGFSGASQFSRAFRKIIGMTPSQWRGKAFAIKMLLKNIRPLTGSLR